VHPALRSLLPSAPASFSSSCSFGARTVPEIQCPTPSPHLPRADVPESLRPGWDEGGVCRCLATRVTFPATMLPVSLSFFF
jgi:hypothetical protein